MICFDVTGKPEPKGSWKAVGRGKFTCAVPANSKYKTWERAVSLSASLQAPDVPIDAPVEVSLTFRFARPKKPKFSTHAVKPDLDKLARCTLDALTKARIFVDDSRVCQLDLKKRFVEGDESPGCLISVRLAK
jgi:crossover junction endodeoxyribonuclease RusA